MSGFHDVSLPLAFALGASGGPSRRVDVVMLGSGRETRNAPWAHSRRRYDIGGAVRTLDQLHDLIGFFEARRGRLYGFRFRDPFDCKSCAPSAAPGPLDQWLGAGDGAVDAFALSKAYGEGEALYRRPIRKPVAGSVRVAVDGVELGAGFSVDHASGVVAFASPPPPGAVLTAGFLFDTPVRFDAETLELSLDAFNAGRAPSAPLIEILL